MNLILITVDCLRADHLGCLGYPERTTPNLDYLASTGILFSQAISVGSWTATSFIAILTSTYPLMYGGQLRITDSRTTVAQVLKEHGYHTAAFHSNPWLSSYFGYHRGFDTFDSSMSKIGSESLLRKPKELVKRIIGTKGKLYHFISQLYDFMSIHPVGSDLNRKAVRWLRDNPSNFFLWLHYMDVHEPYYHPSFKKFSPFERYHLSKLTYRAIRNPGSLSPEEVNKLIHLYDAKISYVDKIIGSLLRTLKPNNMLDNTFVVITADHGQQLMEHGYCSHGGFHLYDELVHVPLIIIGPGLPSQVISQQVSLLDLAPTILDMLEIEKPRAFLGNSLLPLITGNKVQPGDIQAISETDSTVDAAHPRSWDARLQLDTHQRVISLRTGKWKYIYNERGQDELYHLEDDPKETQNMIDAQPDIATELRAKIMAHIEFEDRSTPGERELIKARVRKLKDGGKI
jgi:arylsulfatase A-like enzyme